MAEKGSSSSSGHGEPRVLPPPPDRLRVDRVFETPEEVDKDREENPELWKKYSEQLKASEGFDIDDFPGVCYATPVVPIVFERSVAMADDCFNLANFALGEYNKQPGNPKYKFVKVLKGNVRAAAGLIYYITFKVTERKRKRGEKPAVKIFQAKVWLKIPGTDVRRDPEIQLFRPRKKPKIKVGQTYEDRNGIIRSIPDFWLKVFLQHHYLGRLLTEEDEKIFKYLSSIEVEDFKDVKLGYSITFNFNPNPYLEDAKLTKTLTFDKGTTRIPATPIKWKEAVNISNEVAHEKKGNKLVLDQRSFLVNWFSGDMDDLHEYVAQMIKEDLWPNPLVYIDNEDDEQDVGGEEGDDEENDEDDNQEDDDDDVKEVVMKPRLCCS